MLHSSLLQSLCVVPDRIRGRYSSQGCTCLKRRVHQLLHEFKDESGHNHGQKRKRNATCPTEPSPAFQALKKAFKATKCTCPRIVNGGYDMTGKVLPLYARLSPVIFDATGCNKKFKNSIGQCDATI